MKTAAGYGRNDMSDDVEYFVIPRDHIHLAQLYHDRLEEFKAHMEAKKKAFQDEMESEVTKFKEQQRLDWTNLCTVAGVDAAKSWNKINWSLDSGYLKEGFAALVHTKLPEGHPMAALIDETPENQEKVPEGTTVN